MATPRPPRSGSEAAVDPEPLLAPDGGRLGSRRLSLGGAARFLRRASSRRMLREPSMLVRETAAEQIEERQADWAFSRPVVFLDLLWNLAFIAVAGAVLVLSRDETPGMPLRLWVVGYAIQCALHMICVWIEYRRRHPGRGAAAADAEGSSRSRTSSGSSSSREPEEAGDGWSVLCGDQNSIAEHLESVNTMFSFIWWIIGFYWVSAGGQILTHDAPQLYWLCTTFLAFDVFFVVLCFGLACVVGLAMCCCLPCIIAVLYAVGDQEGASEEDICQLPRYKFQRMSGSEKPAPGGDQPNGQVLSAEDAECCICLSAYDDGVELCELPCGHHFHCACIEKWLHINATCPLCKFSIRKSNNNGLEVV